MSNSNEAAMRMGKVVGAKRREAPSTPERAPQGPRVEPPAAPQKKRRAKQARGVPPGRMPAGAYFIGDPCLLRCHGDDKTTEWYDAVTSKMGASGEAFHDSGPRSFVVATGDDKTIEAMDGTCGFDLRVDSGLVAVVSMEGMTPGMREAAMVASKHDLALVRFVAQEFGCSSLPQKWARFGDVFVNFSDDDDDDSEDDESDDEDDDE